MLSAVVFSAIVATATAGGVSDKGFYPFGNPKWDYNLDQTADTCPETCTSTDRCGVACWDKPSAHSDPASNMCGGTSQTPIDLSLFSVDADLKFPDITATPSCTKWTQFANDHAFEVAFVNTKEGYEDYNCQNAKLTYKGIEYTMYQYHFHTPSEHATGGGEYDAEVHMVHISDAGDILVLGVFLTATSDQTLAQNNNLETFWKIAEANGGGADDMYSKYYGVKDQAAIDPYGFIPPHHSYYTYSGSLTTVPCTEGLTWLVFDQPSPIGHADLDKLIQSVAKYPDTITFERFKYYSGRPIQALNGRDVKMFMDTAAPTAPVEPELHLWDQCGGQDYHGSTNCGDHASCTYINQWYSQCTPSGWYASVKSNGAASSSNDASVGTVLAIVIPITIVGTLSVLGLGYLAYKWMNAGKAGSYDLDYNEPTEVAVEDSA